MVLFLQENPYWYGLKILSRTASFWHEKSMKSSLSKNYRFISLKNIPTANAQCAPVQSKIVSEKNGKILAGWSYHYHLPNSTCTKQITI